MVILLGRRMGDEVVRLKISQQMQKLKLEKINKIWIKVWQF